MEGLTTTATIIIDDSLNKDNIVESSIDMMIDE